MASDPRGIARRLERGEVAADAALAELDPLVREAPSRAVRIEAWRLVGDLAGRAFGAPWKVAEEAAFTLLEVARHVDGPAERRALLGAMGRGFRNVWLLPFVHARLGDAEPLDAAAAIGAAGGLGFAGLEAAIASRFLADDAADASKSPKGGPALRRAAIAALGRMGALSAASRLVDAVSGPADEAALALTALTEIHTPLGAEAAIGRLESDPPREVLLAATRYLAGVGRDEVLPTLRGLGRDEDPELRMTASLAARAWKAEKNRDAGERILAALTERDRAVRALLARRLRTLPEGDVLAQAQVLLDDDPRAVLQVLAEVRTAEVSRFLLALAARRELPPRVRARAILSMEADEPWEREALVRLLLEPDEPSVRMAAAITMGAFASLAEVLGGLEPLARDPSADVRGALLWALQLAATPAAMTDADRGRCEALLRKALADEDPFVRRRAAYVAGNLSLAALAPDLCGLARGEERADLRIAAFVGAGELASAAVHGDLVALFRREEDPHALAAASRAIARTLDGRSGALARLAPKLGTLLRAPDPLVRRAAVRLAGLAGGAVSAQALLPLATDGAPGLREEVLTALGRLGAPEADELLVAALGDVDGAIRERAAEALLGRQGLETLAPLVEYVSGEDDAGARLSVAERLVVPAVGAPALLAGLDAALGRLGPDDPVAEPLLALKVAVLEQGGNSTGEADVDAAITALFPTYARLSRVRGFGSLGRSLRTAEALCRTTSGIRDADLSPPIALWVKVLEGYLHAWLAPRLETLQREPGPLWDHVDRLLGQTWPVYQRWLQTRWSDPMDIGGTKVELPLRALPNALRELGERRLKRIDQPLSVTEWARMLLLLAVDHPSGVKNVLKVSATGADQIVNVGHRLLGLAAVRNVVTHRAAAGASTLDAFRRTYYAAFEDLTRLA
jgi:HEAT repeat protein